MKRIQSLFALVALGFLLLSLSFAQDPLTKEQQEDILGGFLDGLGVDSDITEKGLPEAENLVNSINLLEGNTKEEAIDGLKILAGVLDKLPGIIDNVDGNDGADDLFLDGMETIAEDLDSFEINAHEGDEANEIVVRGVSLSQAMNESATQLKGGDYYEAGWAIGDALAEVYLELTPPASEKVLEEVKSKAKGWEAGSPDQITKGYKSLHDFAKAKLGVPDALIKSIHKKKRFMRRNGLVHVSQLRKEDFPENFDAREKWPNCIGPIRSQGECGSCWAYAGTSAFADRVCIATGGKIKKTLSTQYAVNCGPEPDMNACDGGWPDKEFQWFETAGVWQDSCLSYTSGEDPKRGECRTQCQDEAEPNILYAKEGSTFVFEKDQTLEIKKELMTNGPMSTVFDCYDDFMVYKSGIYSHTAGGNPGGHAVKLIGWGKDPATGVEYWLCANSWGADWGDKGYFKIKFGDSNINEQVTAAVPDIERSVLTNQNGPDVPDEDNSGNTAGAEFKKDKDKGGDGEEQPVENGEPPVDNGEQQVEESPADQPTNEEEQPPPEGSAENEGGSDQPMPQAYYATRRVAHQKALRGNQRSVVHRRRRSIQRRAPIRRNEVVRRRRSVVKYEMKTYPAHHTSRGTGRTIHHN